MTDRTLENTNFVGLQFIKLAFSIMIIVFTSLLAILGCANKSPNGKKPGGQVLAVQPKENKSAYRKSDNPTKTTVDSKFKQGSQ
jgi:hypothetical protein